MLQPNGTEVEQPSSSERAGGAMVEFAITLPLLLGLCMAATDFGRLFYHAVTIANAAGAGAFYGARDQLLTGYFAGQEQKALDDSRNLTGVQTPTSQVQAEAGQYCTCPDSSAPGEGGTSIGDPSDPVDPTGCNYIFDDAYQCTGYGTPRVYVKVTVRQRFPLLAPWPMIPGNTEVARTAFMRAD